jgi:hypothetical protein
MALFELINFCRSSRFFHVLIVLSIWLTSPLTFFHLVAVMLVPYMDSEELKEVNISRRDAGFALLSESSWKIAVNQGECCVFTLLKLIRTAIRIKLEGCSESRRMLCFYFVKID